MLELGQVTKTFAGQTVLHPTSLEVSEGQTCVLIGPSGCGKSTLLRLMIGLLRPTTGEVRFQDRLLSDWDLLEMRWHMGYVIQDGGLFPHLTARQNVSLLAEHVGWGRDRIASRITELSQLTRLPESALDRYPVQLSGGQRQRVSLMRALALDPDMLLMDEPLGALDPLIRADLQSDLKEIFATLNKTVVIVTHDLPEAEFFGGRTVLLRSGRIVQQGPISELIDQPADEFVTQFVRAQRISAGALAGVQP